LVLLGCESADPTPVSDAERPSDSPTEQPGEPEDAGTDPSDDEADAESMPSDAAQTSEDGSVTDAGTFEVRMVAAPPTYQGSVNDSLACSATYPTIGFEPRGPEGARFPLFLYFVGTAFSTTDPAAHHDHDAALAVTEAMARRGFVALSVSYDNGPLAWLSAHQNQLACLFDSPKSVLAQACALPQVDCAKGIGTWGHSMGGYVAVMAGNYDSRVRAAWATGYGGDASSMLSTRRLRVVNGEADTTNGTAAVLNEITGLGPGECPDPDQCLRDDGSGWIIVRKSDLMDPVGSSADHCWFYKSSCGAPGFRLEPSWIDAESTRSFALEPNADWVAATVRRAP
jgi:hypothetical protein